MRRITTAVVALVVLLMLGVLAYQLLAFQSQLQTTSEQVSQLQFRIGVLLSPKFAEELEKMEYRLERMETWLGGFSDDLQLLKEQVKQLLEATKGGGQ